MTETAAPDPHTYYTRTVPAQFNRMLDAQAECGDAGRPIYEDMRAVNATLHVEVLGEGGEPDHFFLNIESGRMAPGDSPDHPPFLAVTLGLDSFEQLTREAGDSLTALLGALAGLAGGMKLTRKRVRELEAVAGTIRFEVGGGAGFSLLTHFGSGPRPDEPDATIEMDEANYHALRGGHLDPQSAFLDDAIRTGGDMQKVMQLAFAAVAPD